MSKRRKKGGKKSATTSVVASAAAFAKKKWPLKPAKTKWKPTRVAQSPYKSIPVSKEKFEPDVHPQMFASMSAWFLQETPNETAGYFNWDEESNLIDWCWHDEDAVKTSGHVVYGTAKMRMAWPEAGIPTGQWHTHPGIGTFWSATDEKGQLEFLDALKEINPDGYFCFIVIDGLDWHCTKLVWKDGKAFERQNGKVHLNGVPLGGRTKTTTTYGTRYGTGWNGYNYQDWQGNTHVPVKKAEEPKGEVTQPVLIKDLKKAKTEDFYVPDAVKGEQDNEFDQLFDIFLVEHYDWPELYVIITEYYPDDYNQIVSGQISWDWIRKDLLKKLDDELEMAMSMHLAEDDEELLGLSTLKKIDEIEGTGL